MTQLFSFAAIVRPCPNVLKFSHIMLFALLFSSPHYAHIMLENLDYAQFVLKSQNTFRPGPQFLST